MLARLSVLAAACGAAAAELCDRAPAGAGYLSAACAKTTSWVEHFSVGAGGAPEQFWCVLVRAAPRAARAAPRAAPCALRRALAFA
jgi:hypothetical protein